MRKSFLTLEIWSRMYVINFIAQVCAAKSTSQLATALKMLKIIKQGLNFSSPAHLQCMPDHAEVI